MLIGIDWSVKASNHSRDFNRSVANLLFMRGHEVDTAAAASAAHTAGLTDPYLYATWMPRDATFSTWSHARCFAGYEKSSALLSNSQSSARSLDAITHKAWSMFSARAYLHHYARHGFGSDDFMDSFASIEQVISSYKSL